MDLYEAITVAMEAIEYRHSNVDDPAHQDELERAKEQLEDLQRAVALRGSGGIV